MLNIHSILRMKGHEGVTEVGMDRDSEKEERNIFMARTMIIAGIGIALITQMF